MQSTSKKRGFAFMTSKARSKSGFALIAALMAIWILTAVGILVFTISTQDIRISSRVIGEKKAFSAAESGIHRFMQSFDPATLAASAVSNVQVDSTNDPDSRYTVGTPFRPTSGPASVPLVGYAIGGGQQWGQERFNAAVSGTNTRYNSLVQVNIGAGYGPVEITTAYR
jgi:Tfp pilus assembly protein PilX